MRDLRLVERARQALKAGNFFEALRCLDEFAEYHGSDMPEQALLDEAERIKQRDYIDRVAHIAKSLAAEWCAGTYAGRSDEAREAFDNATSVSYYSDAKDVLVHANDNAADIDHGMYDWRHGIPWCALAYEVLGADVRERLKDVFGIDWNNDPPKEAVNKCSGCDEWKPRKGFSGDFCEDCRDDAEEEGAELCGLS